MSMTKLACLAHDYVRNILEKHGQTADNLKGDARPDLNSVAQSV
jgi:hypothetical protein